jgi:SAM-dependent methyltransferase
MASPLWTSADAYERYVGRWSRRVAAELLTWLEPPSGLRWLDVGCGTGVLSEVVLDAASPAALTGVDRSTAFLERARARLGPRVTLVEADAAALPLADDSVDATVSGLVLNFVPDPTAALAEIARVTVPDGTVAVYVWDYSGGMEMMRRFWDAAEATDPASAAIAETHAWPVTRAGGLADAFSAAGLAAVEERAIDIETRFSDFDDYWLPYLGGGAPAPAYALSLDEERRGRLRERLRRTLPTRPDGSIVLTARAWAARAYAPAAPPHATS